MKKQLLIFLALLAVASIAQAVTITNLDDVPHRVVFEQPNGMKTVRLINPGDVFHSVRYGEEVYVEGGANNRLKPYALDDLVIWGDGTLQHQMRRKIGGKAF